MKLFLQWQRPLSSRQATIFSILLFVAALLPRLAALGNYITPDELNWVHRSVLFHQALGQGEWVATLTTGHPGVLTTWFGALGIQVQLWLRPTDIAVYDWITHLAWLAPENTAAFPQLATFLSAGRIAVAGVNSLGLLAIFGLARRLAGDWAAAVATGLLALDPFVAGLSGLLHVDGLLTTFTTISLLALAIALTSPKSPHPSASIRVPLLFTAVSGAAAGCAILAKSAGLTLIPFAGLAFVVALLAWRVQWRRSVALGLIWLAAMIAIQFVLLPALWADPAGSYETIISTIFHETEEALPRTFFAGFYKQEHGSVFYPVALLFRLNPIPFAGLLLAALFGLRWKQLPTGWWQLPFLWISLFWPIFFIIVLAQATKKYDRYLLPALPLLYLLGTLGWGQLLRLRPSLTRHVVVGGSAAALVYLLTAVPYLLNAYNPLAGGTLTAKHIMPLGWGEGVSAAAQWLAEQPGVAEKTAVVSIGPAFAPFFPGRTLINVENNRQEADFIVGTLANLQVDHFRYNPCSGPRLVHCIRYDGEIQAWIYANNDPIEPEIVWRAQTVQFGGQIELLAAGTAVQDDQLDIFVQWQLVQPTDGRFNVQIRLLDENDQLWLQLEMPLLNEIYFYPEDWQADEQPIWHYPLELPPGLLPAQYRMELSLFADESGAQLPVVGADGRFAGVVQPIAELDVVPAPLFQTAPLSLQSEPQPLLDNTLLFLGQADLPESILAASNFTVDLYWQGLADLSADLQLQFWANELPLMTLPLSRFDTALWRPGQVIHEKYRVAVPAELAAGPHDLRVDILDGNGRSLSELISLGTMSVVSPDRLFSLPDDIGQPVLLRFGDLISLRGYDLQARTAVTSTLPSTSPGDPIQLTLYWQADRQTVGIFSTFVHFVGPDGQIVVQGDQWPGGLPSNTWAAGQVIIDEYAIQLPDDAPTGSYQIVLGLYKVATGLRLPILAEDGTVLPSDQFVLPLLEVAR
ncbi:ArnT family glycosyltransferase [Candidatus Leptofilum sp.]|uniref:ArnT family glycosyltransferase n=1 Tax=Candidatus Leptofilum sp. TaxID=3241576 RepID=UPI003B5C3429